MNDEDLLARETVRQSRTLADGSRLNGRAAAGLSLPATAPSTRLDSGVVRRLFIPDFDPLDCIVPQLECTEFELNSTSVGGRNG